MNRSILNRGIALALLIHVHPAFADVDTISPNGINSAGLSLTGSGIGIGQVEPVRPGLPGTDAPGSVHSSVIPAAVFRQNGAANVADIDSHAENVAGVMISKDATLAGVAKDAMLYASADNGTPPDFDPESAVSAQHIAIRNGGDVRAINMSFGNPLLTAAEMDGNSLLTQFVDWSARTHDTLYVVAGNEGSMIPVPTDNFNGMTIAYSERVGAIWSRVGARNTYDEDAVGLRTSVSLLAPGDGFPMTNLGSMSTTAPHPVGTSFAAPHVTGAVALLQEFAEDEMLAPTPNPRFDADSRRHQVMKSVLMNSADKIIDNGTYVLPGETLPVPAGRLLGMARTVVDQSGDDWFDSEAYDDDVLQSSGFITLDDQMGAGHLNVGRALTQFTSGEYENDALEVPAIGWDYGSTSGVDDDNRYRFAEDLRGGSFISVTLSWDREVEFATDTAPLGVYNSGDSFVEADPDIGVDPAADNQINDLTLYLLPKFSFTTGDAIAASSANEGTLEHMFFQIPTTGAYELWVFQEDDDVGTDQPYAISWWAANASLVAQGDFNNDGMVDGADLAQWRGDFGPSDAGSDADNDGDSDGADFLTWQRGLGMGSATPTAAGVPEPSAWLLAVVGLLLSRSRRAG